MGRLFRRRRADELAEIDAEITAFGEALTRHSLVPSAHAGDPAVLADYERALNAYEQAKREFVGDRDQRDAVDVMRALDEGGHALARVDARLAGEPLPPRRPVCFFDPRHGVSTDQVRWTPPGGASRLIDVCAADAIRLNEGLPPIATAPAAPSTARLARPPKPARKPRQPNRPKPQPKQAGPKPAPPFKMWPQGTDKPQRAQGDERAEVTLQRPSPDQPLLLVVRIQYEDRNNVVEMGPPGQRRTLLRSKRQRRVVVPLPASEEPEVHLAINAGFSPWWAWLQPADSAPVLRHQLGGEGGYVFRYDGGPARIWMRHTTPGSFSLAPLTPAFEKGEPLLSGRGDTAVEADLSGPTYVHVHAEGPWTIRLLE